MAEGHEQVSHYYMRRVKRAYCAHIHEGIPIFPLQPELKSQPAEYLPLDTVVEFRRPRTWRMTHMSSGRREGDD